MITIDAVIGEHPFQFESASEVLLTYLAEMFPNDDAQVSKLSMSITIHDNYGVPFQDFDVTREQAEGKIRFTRKDYLIEVDAAFTEAVISVYDTFALKHALMNLYSAFIVHEGWGLLMHSSCVVQNDKAYLFSGRSGAGKSTAARLSAPRQILSNEATILKITNRRVLAYNSFAFRSDPGLFVDGTFPLEGIHLLKQSLEIRRERMTSATALTQLLDKVFYWSFDVAETKKLLHMVKMLCESVAVYELYFQKNDAFWREIV